MLPFLKKSRDSGSASISEPIVRKPDDESEPEYDSMDAAADDLIAAVHAKDVQGVSAALRAAYDICESSEPEMEGE